jgi:hypothetical protein
VLAGRAWLVSVAVCPGARRVRVAQLNNLQATADQPHSRAAAADLGVTHVGGASPLTWMYTVPIHSVRTIAPGTPIRNSSALVTASCGLRGRTEVCPGGFSCRVTGSTLAAIPAVYPVCQQLY